MVNVAAAPSPAAVRAALDTVPDPEMPAVGIGELGMVVDVRVASGTVEVDLVATFSGCPAVAVIGEEVQHALRTLDGVDAVKVRWVRSVVWDPQRITPAGRERLRDAGIASPGGGGPALVQLGGRPVTGPQVPCPRCGGDDTTMDSPFGPTPCRDTRYCRACREPFEAVKP